jgi:dTDP-4-amino-4,6-dideoxygalactose transaminase
VIKISDPGIKTKHTVADFEQAIAKYLGYPFAVATNTGTAALYLLAKYFCGDGSIPVQIPPLCFRAVWNAVEATIHKVCYTPSIYHIDVMNYGFPSAAGTHILDASEGFGGDIPKHYRFVTLSFNWNKPVTCGSGGMVLCQNPEDAMHIRIFINQCKLDNTYFIHVDKPGYNFRMNDLQATMGMESFSNLPFNQAMRKKHFLRYLDAGLPVIKPPKKFKWNYWVTLLRTPHRDRVLQAFMNNDIEARAMFTPHTREFPEVNKYAAETMCLPSSPSLTKEEQDKVIRIVKECL